MEKIDGVRYDSENQKIRSMYQGMALADMAQASANRKKLGLGIGAAVLAAGLLTNPGREAVTSVANGIQDIRDSAIISYKYGEAGFLPYREQPMMLGIEHTPETLARFYDNRSIPSSQKLVVKYIMAANNIPDKNSELPTDRVIKVPYPDADGKRLGDLVEEALSRKSQ